MNSGHSRIEPDAAPPIPWASTLAFWLKLGFISFGGPAGQIAVMHQELVERRRWISERRFLHALNYCMLLPGPEAQQLATYLGWLMHRTRGGIVAGVLFVLPSLLILIALGWAYMRFGHVPWIMAVFTGIKPAVVAIVVHAAFKIGARVLHNGWLWAIAVAAFVGLMVFKLPFPLIVLVAAAVGWLGGKIRPQAFLASRTTDAGSKAAHVPALIDDDTPTPPHAQFSWGRSVRVVFVCLTLWAAPLALLWHHFGASHAFVQMAWFFSKAAFLTLGGAYAVLPYIYQAAVLRFSWVTPAQMMDGLALGETTPGPLIMVVAFVAFAGGYNIAPFGLEQTALAGMMAACIATWFTFLPSFFFILLGGPLVESTHGKVSFTAPLTAVTAAVVGVIANLAVFFGMHVFWPQGIHALISLTAVLIAAAAFVALQFFKQGPMRVIVACALLGLAGILMA